MPLSHENTSAILKIYDTRITALVAMTIDGAIIVHPGFPVKLDPPMVQSRGHKEIQGCLKKLLEEAYWILLDEAKTAMCFRNSVF